MDKFFISHYSEDKRLAKIIAELLKRISLGQLDTWFSSDEGNGGLQPGQKWFDEIIGQLKTSKAVVVLLTPHSLKKQWLYFESGIGEAIEQCEIIPVIVGLNGFSDIPFPLALYQSYNLSDYSSLKSFVIKLLGKYSVVFDEEMAQPVLEKSVREIGEIITEQQKTNSDNKNKTNDGSLENIKAHFDRRFLNLIQILEQVQNIEDPNNFEIETIEIEIDFPPVKTIRKIGIMRQHSVQDIMDEIYFMLPENVQPFSYLKDWILVDETESTQLILREIMNKIPASLFFNSQIKWIVKKLDEPYTAAKIGK